MADHIRELVRGAVRAVPGADGAELWALAFQTLLGLELPLQGLARELEAALAALPKGPLEVSWPCIKIQGKTTFRNLASGYECAFWGWSCRCGAWRENCRSSWLPCPRPL